MTTSEATRLIPLNQSATKDYFTLCDKVETGEEIGTVPHVPNKKSLYNVL